MWALRPRFSEVWNACVLSHIVLSSQKHPKCLSTAQDFLAGKDPPSASNCPSKVPAKVRHLKSQIFELVFWKVFKAFKLGAWSQINYFLLKGSQIVM